MTPSAVADLYSMSPNRKTLARASHGSVRRPLSPRYVGVLAVWLALFVVRPRLALEIFERRRADSPIPRWR